MSPEYFADSHGYLKVREWMDMRGIHPFAFQEEAWKAIAEGSSGLVNAPTGCGKTYSVFLGSLIRFINRFPDDYRQRTHNGLQLLWITPLRALAKDIARAMEEVIQEMGLSWKVGIRNGDTETGERQRQKSQMPEILIITPESLHLLLAQRGYPETFDTLELAAVDEWHELLGTKRGVQVELALARVVSLYPGKVSVWGISATIGNLEEAREVLMHPLDVRGLIIRAEMDKQIEVESIFPDEIEKFPWAGHLGIKLAHKVIPIIENSRTTLIFINTRGMSETWYQTLLDTAPHLSGALALHHGSIEHDLRIWVEEALHTGRLKAVVCTSSLDLGVDFRPVETVIQVGSPKGVARFVQRAGRSGHRPGDVSRIYFLPTHSLELVEAAALKQAVREATIESRDPMVLSFDVLIQFLGTLSVSGGFTAEELLPVVKSTWSFAEMQESEWQQVLGFVTTGGTALNQYDEFRKIERDGDGVYRMTSRRMAMRHRMHIGTIVSEAMLKVRFMGGGYIGVIEEYFISRLKPGDVFTLAGRNLEFIMIRDMTAIVKKSNSKKSIVPSWMGGRMPLSAKLGRLLRQMLNEANKEKPEYEEIRRLRPLFDKQAELSHIPAADELLIEHIETRDGFHLFVHTFEGRLVNEAMAAILAYRISRISPITFSFAMNDYSFELLSDRPIPVDDGNVYELFSPEGLFADIQRSVNATEMARRKFRDIAVIGGLVFQGFPGEQKKARHLQASASLLFQVFSQYDPDNLLLKQSYQEVFDQQMEEVRLRNMLERISDSRIVIRFPSRLTPFSFPVKVDSMRESLSSEKLEDRIRRML